MNKEMDIRITLRNLAYLQPMTPFLVVVHNDDSPDLFRLGYPATAELGDLAETGNATGLQLLFEQDMANVASVGVKEGKTHLLEGGKTQSFVVTVSCDYPFVSMASMAVNTNDCFVGINKRKLTPGMVLATPGYDAGSEANNEDCDFIPGPAW